jgi:hypothetical protein
VMGIDLVSTPSLDNMNAHPQPKAPESTLLGLRKLVTIMDSIRGNFYRFAAQHKWGNIKNRRHEYPTDETSSGNINIQVPK